MNSNGHKFVLLIHGENEYDEEFDTFEEAQNLIHEDQNNLSAGRDVYELMGDIDDNEIIDPDSEIYEIVEYDEDGNEVKRTKLDSHGNEIWEDDF